MVLHALHNHRHDARLWVVAAVLHVAFVVFWWYLDTGQQATFYRHSITFAMVMAAIFYIVVILAFLKAHKSRLNKALALNKSYWLLLILLFAIPLQTRWWEAAPQSVRTYIWLGIALSVPWVLYEFVAANWGDEWDGSERRRRLRRSADEAAYAALAREQAANPGPEQERR